jgi:hypothetical protein
MIAQRLLTTVVFAGQPEDVVAIEDSPDGGKGVAVAKIDAADFFAAGDDQ